MTFFSYVSKHIQKKRENPSKYFSELFIHYIIYYIYLFLKNETKIYKKKANILDRVLLS